MTVRAIRFFLFISSAILLFLFAGCGRPPKTVFDQPSVPNGYWELIWAEPKMIMSDSLFMLIRSDWVDSVFTETDQPLSHDRVVSLEFEVSEQSCFVSVNLHRGTDGIIILPLLAKQLPVGWYKLTPSTALLSRFTGPLMLRARACGQMNMVWLVQ